MFDFYDTSPIENTHNLNITDDDVFENDDSINPESGITETAATEEASDDNNENKKDTPLASPRLLTLTPGNDSEFPGAIRETEENKEKVVNNSSIKPQKLWSNNSENPKEWKGEDVLPKSNV